MSQQTIKQKARTAARGVAARRRREQLEREGRLVALAVQVMTAIAERDNAVADAERRAAHALREMTDVEGLALREVAEWCDEQDHCAGGHAPAAPARRQWAECGDLTRPAPYSSIWVEHADNES